MARALLFDFDGTLYGDWRVWISIIEETLDSYQISIDPHDVLKKARIMIENGGEPQSTLRISSVAGVLARDRGVNLDEQMRARFFERLDARMDSTGPDREITAVLEDLQRARYRLGIVTFVRKGRISRRLDVWKLKSLFGSVITPDDVTEVKPSPQPFFAAMKELHVKPENSFVVGDEPVDMLGGKSAGATTVGIPQGFFTRQELEKAGADHILSSLVQLRDIVSTT